MLKLNDFANNNFSVKINIYKTKDVAELQI